jgi:hypothetical protein
MRISTITNWAYGATLVLTGVSAAAFLAAGRAAETERAALEQHLAFAAVSEDLTEGAEELTDAARLVAMRGEPRALADWRLKLTTERRRERALEQVRRMDASPAERAAVAEAEAATGLVADDPIRFGSERILDAVLAAL